MFRSIDPRLHMSSDLQQLDDDVGKLGQGGIYADPVWTASG